MIHKKYIFLLLVLTLTVYPDNLLHTKYSDLFNAQRCSQIINKKYYSVCYDYDKKMPLTIAYTLDGDKVGKVNIKTRPRFYPAYEIPKRYRAYYYDFSGGIFDRGHMRPDAATDWDYIALKSTYSLMNIVPQYKWLNRKMWSKAERYSRNMAIRLGSVDVINLIQFEDNAQKIGKHHISVPSGFYKIIYSDKDNFKRCFYYKNKYISKEDARRDKLRYHKVECDSIEL